MKRFLLLLLLPAFLSAQEIETVAKDATHPYGLVVVKPSTYSIAKSYPLMIYLHGTGGRGSGSPADLQRLVNGELPLQVQRAAELFDFVVIAPQTPGNWQNPETDAAIAYAMEELKIDWKKLYYGALSLGGGGATRYLSANLANAKKFAGAVIACGLNWITNAKNIADAGVPIVFFHALDDGIVDVSNADNAAAAINNFNPPVKAKKVIYTAGDHWIWGKVFSTDVSPFTGNETPATIYDWLLMNEAGAPVSVPETAPDGALVANAGPDFSTTTNSITLNGKQSKSYAYGAWKTISVPAGVNIWAVNACGWITCNVKLPAPGKYVFQLIVQDKAGAKLTDQVTVTYQPGGDPPPPDPPRILQAVIYFADGTWLKVYTDKSQEKNY